MDLDGRELRKGLAETRKFVLAHHLPAEFYRCYSLPVFGRRIHLCARCTGIYPGIIAGILAYVLVLPEDATAVFVALLPLPALIDWCLTTFLESRGSNIVRTLTGASLGVGYGLGLSLLVFEWEMIVLAIGLGYAILASILIYYSF